MTRCVCVHVCLWKFLVWTWWGVKFQFKLFIFWVFSRPHPAFQCHLVTSVYCRNGILHVQLKIFHRSIDVRDKYLQCQTVLMRKNARPHQLFWGDQKIGITKKKRKCFQRVLQPSCCTGWLEHISAYLVCWARPIVLFLEVRGRWFTCSSMNWFQPITQASSGDPEMGTIKRTKAFSWLAYRVQMYTCLCGCSQFV